MEIKKFATLVVCAFMALATYAQRPNVFIDYFGRPNDISFTWAEGLRSNVIFGLAGATPTRYVGR